MSTEREVVRWIRTSLPHIPPLALLSTRAHVRRERASDTTYVQCMLTDLYVLLLMVIAEDHVLLEVFD